MINPSPRCDADPELCCVGSATQLPAVSASPHGRFWEFALLV